MRGWLFILLLVWPAVALAQPDASQPVMVEADEFGYDTENATVRATGNAEVLQDDYTVLADEITYDQKTGIVRARGNVAVAEPTGNVYFAEEVALQNEVKTGVIQNFRARLSDNSLFVAREARKIDENTTEMEYAVYSACKVCDDGGKQTPFWQLKARKIRYDEEKQSIKYNHARMEVFGVPMLYTPYFSHAAPGADRKSGLLMPSYALSGNLGATLHVPYYWNIAPNKDAVITPIYTSDEGPVLAGEYRHLLRSGYYELGGSITRPDRVNDNTGIRASGQEWRGHVEGRGEFRLTDFWEWGFDAKHTSDDTYLRRYEFGYEDLLTSKIYLNGYDNRTFANVEAIGFQGLRSEDDSSVIPYIHPLVDASHETEPGWEGSRFGVSGNAMALSREEGAQSRRLSSTAYWRVPHVTEGGHVFELRTQLRADVYSVEEVATTTTGGAPDNYNGVSGRVIPEVWLDWRYPLLKRLPNASLIIEPTAQLVAGVNGLNSNTIPNEDSLALEFSDSNLFAANHYPGYDLVESGTRVNYGIRSQLHFDGGSHIHFLFGQNYHTDNNNLFPYSNDLDEEMSDYVGRLAWNYTNALQLAYRFRLDQQSFELKRSEVEGRINANPVRLRMNYVKLEEDPYLENSEELRAAAALRLTDQWTWTLNGRRDMEDDGGMIRAGTGLVFQNECVTLGTSINRYYIRDRDVEPSTSVKLEVLLRNLN